MHIPFVDLTAQYLAIKEQIDNAIQQVITETAFIGGKHVAAFETEFAQQYGVQNCISCGNGTDALYIILKILGIGVGDEVITPANSWISSSETISQTGAMPVFIDAHPYFFSINEQLIEAAITPKTKAIVAVHLHGQMCNMPPIVAICKKYNLLLVEDCAQAHFSANETGLAGTFGNAAAFSFYPGKNLGAYGDAGCILTNDNDLAKKCTMYARHGALLKHQHQMEGINSRMDGLQAAILRAKLPFIAEWTNQRISHAAYYNTVLAGITCIALPQVRPNTKHTFHLYVIKAKNRDALRKFLTTNGIETAVHYPTPLPFLPAYKHFNFAPSDFPVCYQQQHEILSLPIYPELSIQQMEYIATQIRYFYQNS